MADPLSILALFQTKASISMESGLFGCNSITDFSP